MHSHSGKAIFRVNHNQIKERFWNLGSAGEGIQEHTDYNEFLRINNLQNG